MEVKDEEEVQEVEDRDSSFTSSTLLRSFNSFIVRRILISGLALLLGAGALVHVARSLPTPASRARAGKNDPLVFVFLRVDANQNLAILRPMIAPDIGVQLDSGSRQLEKRAVLQCRSAMREHDALVDGQISKFSEMLLDCGDYKFVVKAIDFSPQR